MYDDLEVGSIVLLMNAEYNVYKAMIVQKNVKEGAKDYRYLAIPYPLCFIGVDSFTLINEEHIYDVVYDSSNKEEVNSKELCPSSIIEYNNEDYLIVGKNVKYLGKEKDNEYAVVKKDAQKAYEIEYIKENRIENIKSYGFVNQEYMDLEADRYNILNTRIRRFRAFLPIGSIVELTSVDGEDIEVMILARNVEVDKSELVDYTGIRHEHTYIGNDYVFKFDKEQIKRIIYIGHFNYKEVEYNKEILISRGIIDRS